jgi:hydroxyquinol 1,2-dioxygenase
MSTQRENNLVREVLSRFENCQSERYQEIMQSLVRHLHSFLQEVQLTQEEWEQGIDFLTRAGHITDDKRQEFILASDVLGASMQVVNINNPKSEQATEATVFGPFFVEGSPKYAIGDDISNGARGEPCYIYGRVLDQDGVPIPEAHIAAWQSDEDGYYDVQYAGLDRMQNRGQLDADDDGNYAFWAIKPEPYPIPYDGPVGDLLKAANRSPMRPAHVHFMVTAPGYRRLITHVFESKSDYLDSDAVFGVKPSLIANFEHRDAGTAPDGRKMDNPYYVLNFDLVLVPEGN